MSLDFRNNNYLWSSLIAETFAQLGVEDAVISPGSRSTPLTIAFVENQGIKTVPVLDERSASFFALGIAKKKQKPTILICTSGTAGANFYSAVIEAKYSHIPLIILTADRPSELRNCHAGQAINQLNLYGNYPNWQTELLLPSIELEQLFYLRQNIIYAWEKSSFPNFGVVHLNIPFREPLNPTQILDFRPSDKDFITNQLLTNFPRILATSIYNLDDFNLYLNEWSKFQQGIIIAGVDGSIVPQEYCRSLAFLAQKLNFPVLAEALSPVRNYTSLNNYLVTNYDAILRDSQYAKQLAPEIVILIGKYPTSKILREWLSQHKITTYIIANNQDNIDALHTNSLHLRMNIDRLYQRLHPTKNELIPSSYAKQWLMIEQKVETNLRRKMKGNQEIFEGKISWILSQLLPFNTPILFANSMSVRYAEYFWQKNDRHFQIYFSRGANGIEGTLSTALGIAHQNQPTVLLTGDLALLHDTNGFLINQYLEGSLIIILINNYGGGIFEMLPIADYKSVYEEYFATPQTVDFLQLTKAYNLNYKLIDNYPQLEKLLPELPTQGIYLWEIKTSRQKDSLYLRDILNNISR